MKKIHAKQLLRNKIILLPIMLATLFTAKAALCAGLANTPWPMYGQNQYHTGVSTIPVAGSVVIPRWKYQTGAAVFGVGRCLIQ